MSRDSVLFALPAIPQFVFQCFDEMISQNWDGQQAIVDFHEIFNKVKRMSEAKGLTFTSEWLKVEWHYQAVAGERKWQVELKEEGRNGYGDDGHKYYLFK